MRKKILSRREQILDECADPEEYFLRVVEAKKNGEEWAKDIPCDAAVHTFHLLKNNPTSQQLHDRLVNQTKNYNPFGREL